MGELVPVNSEMDVQWSRMKRAIHLANTVSSSAEETATFKSTLKCAIADSVGRCKAERKRMRDAESPKDTSDAAIVRAAKFTDSLPLGDYDRVLHLVPRLVNVVTVSARHSFKHGPQTSNRSSEHYKHYHPRCPSPRKPFESIFATPGGLLPRLGRKPFGGLRFLVRLPEFLSDASAVVARPFGARTLRTHWRPCRSPAHGHPCDCDEMIASQSHARALSCQRAARRGHPRAGFGHQAPVGLARDRVALFEFLLRPSSIRGRPARIRCSSLSRLNFSHGQTRGNWVLR